MYMKPEIVEYAKERYIEEHQRFDHIENKCGRIMAFTTILITAITALLSFFSTSLFQPNGLLDYAILIITALSVFVLICSWGHALLSIKLGSVNIAPRKENNFKYMQENTNEKMYQHMVNCYLDPIKNTQGHPLLNAPLKKPENFKVNFTTIYVILMKIMKGVEINAQVT
jgi:hypothetical protein